MKEFIVTWFPSVAERFENCHSAELDVCRKWKRFCFGINKLRRQTKGDAKGV